MIDPGECERQRGGASRTSQGAWKAAPKSPRFCGMITLNARPEPITIDLERTALVIVDMQNAFASKGGMFDLAGFDISGAASAIEVTRRLLSIARKAGLAVIHLQMTFKPDLSNAGDVSSPAYHKELALRMMRERPELSGKLLIENTWDWQFVDALMPAPGEHVVRKSRYNGFVRTDLDDHLRRNGIRHLLFTGIATNVCVESTARHAFFNEYWPVLIEDAMNNSGPDFNRQATLWNFEHVLGWVTHSRDVLAVLEAQAAERVPA
jgi:ureidoacrylate peracid hydrolase